MMVSPILALSSMLAAFYVILEIYTKGDPKKLALCRDEPENRNFIYGSTKTPLQGQHRVKDDNIEEHLHTNETKVWPRGQSRDVKIYLEPDKNTTIRAPTRVCRSITEEDREQLFLLIIVHSPVESSDQRNIIRNTWGSYTYYKAMKKYIETVGQKFDNESANDSYKSLAGEHKLKLKKRRNKVKKMTENAAFLDDDSFEDKFGVLKFAEELVHNKSTIKNIDRKKGRHKYRKQKGRNNRTAVGKRNGVDVYNDDVYEQLEEITPTNYPLNYKQLNTVTPNEAKEKLIAELLSMFQMEGLGTAQDDMTGQDTNEVPDISEPQENKIAQDSKKAESTTKPEDTKKPLLTKKPLGAKNSPDTKKAQDTKKEEDINQDNIKEYNMKNHPYSKDPNIIDDMDTDEDKDKDEQDEEKDFKVLFLVGFPDRNQHKIQQQIDEEVTQYGDVIQENFLDSYQTLTLKSVFMLKWVTNNCKGRARYILKTDDDVFINVPFVVMALKAMAAEFDRTPKFEDHSEYVLMGQFQCGVRPDTLDVDHKWYTPKYMYKGKKYPCFAAGMAYVMSAAAAPALYRAALRVPLLHVEDVFVSGLCRLAARPPLAARNVSWLSYAPACRHAALADWCAPYTTALCHEVSRTAMMAMLARMLDVRNIEWCAKYQDVGLIKLKELINENAKAPYILNKRPNKIRPKARFKAKPKNIKPIDKKKQITFVEVFPKDAALPQDSDKYLVESVSVEDDQQLFDFD